MNQPSVSIGAGAGAPDAVAELPRERGTSVPLHPRRGRVPECDIVDVGPRPGDVTPREPIDVRELIAPAAAPKASPGPGWLRRVLVALLALEVAVLGGIYVGKRYASSQVILVPPPADDRSVIT